MNAAAALLLFILAAQSPSAKSQEVPDWNMDSIRISVKALLEQYRDVHNQINASSGAEVERAFVRLFSNSKILVVNDLEERPGTNLISVQDYISTLPVRFPDGLTLSLNVNRMILSRPKYDFNNRYLIKARIEKGLMGFRDGKVFASNHKVVISIGFDLINGQMSEFEIRGITFPAKGEDFSGILVAPAVGALLNKQLNQDQRFGLQRSLTYKAGIQYAHYFNDHWGIRTGLNYTNYPASITLDEFDPIGGFDPDMSEVSFSNHLWYIELPIGLSYKTLVSKRISVSFSTGLITGYRLFESFSSTAVNDNTGKIMAGVISDTDWISGLNRVNLAFFAEAALAWFIKPDLALTAGVEYVHGIRSVGYVNRPDYNSTRYQGQYNPIWSVPDSKTFSQSACLSFGTLIRFKWHNE